jgi:hypothetical protein
VTLYYRGLDRYIGCAKTWDEAVEIERRAKANFPPEQRRNAAKLRAPRVGYFRDTSR